MKKTIKKKIKMEIIKNLGGAKSEITGQNPCNTIFVFAIDGQKV